MKWVTDVRRNRETGDMWAPPQGARVGFGPDVCLEREAFSPSSSPWLPRLGSGLPPAVPAGFGGSRGGGVTRDGGCGLGRGACCRGAGPRGWSRHCLAACPGHRRSRGPSAVRCRSRPGLLLPRARGVTGLPACKRGTRGRLPAATTPGAWLGPMLDPC